MYIYDECAFLNIDNYTFHSDIYRSMKLVLASECSNTGNQYNKHNILLDIALVT